MYLSLSVEYIFFNLNGTSPEAVLGTNTNGNYLFSTSRNKKSTGAYMHTINLTFGKIFIGE